jgi:hypothetical protein
VMVVYGNLLCILNFSWPHVVGEKGDLVSENAIFL